MRFGLVGLLAVPLALSGCVSLAPGVRAEGEPGEEIRAEAPPEYDLLVAQLHKQEGRLDEAVAAYERAIAKDGESAFLHRKAAEAMAMDNRLDDAVHHATIAFELDPDDHPTRLFLGQLHRIRRDPVAAEGVLRDESGQPIDEQAALLLYQVYLGSGRPADALRSAEWLVERDPDSLRARVAMANALQQLGRPIEAEEALREALVLDPGDLRVYSALARSLRQRGEIEAEIELYRDVLEEYPRHHATLVALSDAYMALDELESAIDALVQVERYYPEDLHSVVRLGFLEYEARRFEEAARRFERVLEVNPEEHQVAFFLGIVRRRTGDQDAAIEAFERIPPEHQHYAEARTQIAAILERRGEFEAALAEIEKVAAVKPSRDLELYRATLRARAGDFDGAIAELQSLLTGTPDDDEIFYNLGVVYGEAKRVEEAVQYMQRALEQNPDNASALNYVGYTWAERGVRLDEAESMITRAIELRPDDGYIADSLGWVYYMRARPLVESGRREEAQEYIERALRELKRAAELTGGDPVISEHLGDTYLLLNEKRHALEQFEEALRLEPREGEQPDLLEKLETLQRELE